MKLAHHTLCATAAAAAAMLMSPMASAELSANVAATSNYVWRGVTQTDDGAALQGGVDYAHDSGLYVGAWGSNVSFPDADIDGIEYDIYAGFSNEIGQFGYDIGYFTYSYTDEDADTMKEIKLGVSYGPATVNHYLGDAGTDTDNEYTYTELNLEFDLPAETKLALHYGVTQGDYVEANDPDGDEQQADYSAGISKEFVGINVALNYADHDEDDGAFFVTLSKDFEL